MLLLSSLINFAAAFASTAVPAPAATQFTLAPPPVNQVIIQTQTMKASLDMKVTVDGEVVQEGPTNMENNEERRTTVLAADDDAPTRIRVEFPVARESQDGMTNAQPVQGHAYVIDDTGATLSVTREDGSQASAIEIEFLNDEFGDLSEPDDFVKLMNGKSVEVGETIEVSKEAARGIFDDESLEVERMALTFKGEETINGLQCGVFDVVLNMKGADGTGVAMTMTVTGKLVMSVQCWPVSLDLSGNMAIDGSQDMGGQSMVMSGKGPLTLSIKAEYK